MAVHYTRERAKYGTLTGSIIAWPVEVASPSNPNNSDNIKQLPAGYLRCDGSKYKASEYPLLAQICGTGPTCKFAKVDQNGNLIGTIGDDEFVVPDLGSKYPRPVSGGDAGVFNSIITETQSGTFIKRSGIGIEATSNVGNVAQVTYSGKFILPAQTIEIKGKPSWTWGNSGRTDSESVENNMIHPHMHFSSTSRVRIKSKSGATGGVLPIGGTLINAGDPSLNAVYNNTAFVSFGSGTGETGGFASPGFNTGYIAFGGPNFTTLRTTREYTVTLDNSAGYTLLAITSIVGNDTNGGERPNNVGEGLYIIWPNGQKSTSPIIPSREESGLQGSQYDAQYASWLTQTLPIPAQYQGVSSLTLKFQQIVVGTGGGLDTPNFDGTELVAGPSPATSNCYDMCGIVQIGLTGGFVEDPNLVDTGNDVPIGINYFQTASTIDVQAWLDNTKAKNPSNNTPGSGQPACWAIASGTLAGSEIQDQNLNLILPIVYEVIQRYNFCNTGCQLSNLRCFCLLKQDVTYDLEKDWFGIEGTRYSDLADSLGFCGVDPFGPGQNVPWNRDGVVRATYNLGSPGGVPIDWKGVSLDDVLPLSSVVQTEEVFPQARNIYSVVDEYPVGSDDQTIHDHKIIVERENPNFSIITNATLIDPDNLNTTLSLTPSTVASIDVATIPFIVVEYLIKT